jgi:hypothetical protein
MGRAYLNSSTFTSIAIEEARKDVVCPLPLNEAEYTSYLDIYAQRVACEWRGDELKMACELSRINVQIEHLSSKMSQQGFVDPDLALYERLSKVRDRMRVTLKLNIVSMVARTLQSQKSVADKIVNGLGGVKPKAKRIDWEQELNV